MTRRSRYGLAPAGVRRGTNGLPRICVRHIRRQDNDTATARGFHNGQLDRHTPYLMGRDPTAAPIRHRGSR